MFFKSLLELDTRDEVCNCFFKKKKYLYPWSNFLAIESNQNIISPVLCNDLWFMETTF